MMNSRCPRLLLSALLAAGGLFGPLAGAAQAAPATAVLESTNGSGAGDCPQADALAAIVNDGLGRAAVVPAGTAAEAHAMHVVVAFERAPKGYAATVRIDGARGGTRRLSNGGPGCGALANAVGVLLVVALDSSRADDTAAAAAQTSSSRPDDATALADRAITADLGIGGGVAQGLVGGWSPAVGLGGTLAYGHLAARLGGVWLPSKTNAYGPGRIEIGLAVARLALCVSTRDDRSRVALGLCAQQQIGWMRGRGIDYEAGNRAADHLWLATGAAIVAGGPLGRSLGWEVEVAAVRPLQQQRFVVDNLGTAFQSDAAAFMTTLAFTTRLW
jgi:hypothetical protein